MKNSYFPFPIRACASLGISIAFAAAFPAQAQEAQPRAEARPTAAKQSQPATADEQSTTIRGRIEGFRHYQSSARSGEQKQPQRADEQTLVNVRLQDGRSVVIALGSKIELDELKLQRNDFIIVEGRARMVEGVPALAASRLEVNGQRVTLGQKKEATSRQVDGHPAQEQRSPVIQADARELLDKVRTAYEKAKTLRLAGLVSSHFEIGNSVVKTHLGFTSAFEAPNKFQHDTVDMLIGSTGEQVFVLNKKTNNYLQQKVAAKEPLAKDLPATGLSVLHAQNPSLLAALLRSPFQRVLESAESIEKLDDAVIENKRYPQLVLRGIPGHGPISVLVNPENHLVRRVKVNLRPALPEDATDKRVRQATITVDYTLIDTATDFAADRFAWQPPEKATDVAQQRQTEEQASQGLVGKTAPAFELTALDGRKVSLAEQRGKVVVLDFWASWCPPCKESLPHLGRMFGDEKQENVEFFAINVGEEKDRIQSFLQAENLEVPVLLDPDGKVARQYQVKGIPKTVVIDPEGQVTKVFTGLGADSYEQIREAIKQASGRAAAAGSPAPENARTARTAPEGN